MAKKKKHSKKKFKRKHNVANITTQASKVVEPSKPKATKKEIIEPKKANDTAGTKEVSAEIKDVRYSLLLAGVIVLVFAVIYVVLQNQSVSNSIYGIINISK